MKRIIKCVGIIQSLNWILFLIVFLSAGTIPDSAFADLKEYQGKTAKYIFLFIGDGMGNAHRAAVEKYSDAQLVMESLPVQGITSTFAADRLITDSAAAATAISSGQKTNIGMLGMAPDQRPVKTIAEIARDKGQKVGIVSSVTLDHATPAAFYSHVASRYSTGEIDKQLGESNFDFFGGGGLLNSLQQNKKLKLFKINTKEILEKAGYTIISDKRAFEELRMGSGKVFARNPNLQDKQAMPYAIDMEPEDMGLARFTEKAIEMLDNPKGFFIMVEGGKIDWACHANDAATAIQDILSLDKALQKAMDFAQDHMNETLIVVTSDHETGGLSLGGSGVNYPINLKVLDNQKLSFRKFADELFPEFQKRCGADCSFESIKPLIAKNFGLKFSGNVNNDPMVLKPHEIDELKEAFQKSFPKGVKWLIAPINNFFYGEYPPLIITVTRILNNKAGLGWKTFDHTEAAVTTSAIGIGADSFSGSYDNTDIAKKIMTVMGIIPNVYNRTEKIKAVNHTR